MKYPEPPPGRNVTPSAVQRYASPHFPPPLTAEARDKPAMSVLRWLTVLTVLFKHASGR